MVIQQEWKNIEKMMGFLGKKKALYLFMTCLCNAIGSVCYNIVLAVIMQKILDGIVLQRKELLVQAVWIAAISFFIAFVFEPIFARKRNGCVRSAIAGLRREIFCSVTGMSVRTYESMSQGDILTKATNDVELVEQIYLSYIPNLCFALIHGGIAAILMVFYNVWLGVISLLLGGIQTGISYWMSRKVRRMSEKRQKIRTEVIQKVIDTLDGRVDWKAARSEKFFKKSFRRENQQLKTQERAVENRKMWMEDTDNFFENFNYIIVLGLGFYMMLRGWTSLGTVVAIISLQGNATYLFRNLSGFLGGIAETLPSVERIIDIISLPREETASLSDSREKKSQETDAQTAIGMRNVTFHYDNSDDILKQLNCSIKKGELSVITGESGAGKSTWMKLLLGFYDIFEGEYFLFGKNVKAMGKKALGSQIAYVDQSCYLFQMSVADNVRMGRLNASREEIILACQAAAADEFIETLPDGYDTMLLNGENLSGGQKQRIALARAFLSQKPILLIDEGTANLDSLSEEKVIDSVANMKGKRTIIVISHRNAWEKCADRIYRLEKKTFRTAGWEVI